MYKSIILSCAVLSLHCAAPRFTSRPGESCQIDGVTLVGSTDCDLLGLTLHVADRYAVRYMDTLHGSVVRGMENYTVEFVPNRELDLKYTNGVGYGMAFSQLPGEIVHGVCFCDTKRIVLAEVNGHIATLVHEFLHAWDYCSTDQHEGWQVNGQNRVVQEFVE